MKNNIKKTLELLMNKVKIGTKELFSNKVSDNPENFIIVSAPKDSPVIIYSIGENIQMFYKN